MKTKKWKRVLGVVLSGTMAMTALSAGMTAFAAEADGYPDGVTAEQAKQAVTTLDTVLNDSELLGLVAGLANGAQDVVVLPEDAEDLRDLAEQVVNENLYQDSTVTALAKLIYPAISDLLGSLDIGIDITGLLPLVGIYLTPKDVGSHMSAAYGEAKAALSAAGSDWSAVADDVVWNVTDADSFYAALGEALNGLTPVLNLVLNNGTLLGVIQGCAGYQDAIVPLLEVLGCKDISATAGSSMAEMLKNILEPIINRVYEICDAPATELLELLPVLAEFIENDGITTILYKLELTALGNKINIGELVSGMVDLSDMNALIKSLIPEGSLNWVDIDFAALAALKGDAGKVLVWVLEYAGQMVNANAEMIENAIPAIEDEKLAAIVTPIIEKVLTTDPSNLAALVINLLAPKAAAVSAYNYPAIEKVDFVYPEGVLYGEDAYAAAPAAIDGLLAGFGLDLTSLVSGALYTNDLINSVLGLYDTIAADQTVMDVFAALGIDTDFAAVKAAAQAINVTDKASFIDALTVALSPFDELVALVLAGQDYDVFGYSVKGMQAYNTVVIPLLEVLGCTDVMSYADYQAAVAGGASPLEAVLTQVLDRLDEILAAPVDTVVELLPNLAYFLDSNNLSVMIENVAAPIIELLAYVDIDAMAVVDELLNAYGIPAIDDLDNDLAGLLNQVLGLIEVNGAPLGLQLPAIDLHVLASYGTAEAYTSAMVVDGQNVQATRIVADKADVTGAVIRYLYTVLSDQATVDLLMGLLGDSGAMVGGILESLLGNGEAGFTNALFELLGLTPNGEAGGDVNGNENVNTGDATIAVVAGAAVLAAGAVLVLSRKKKEI